MTGYYTHNVPRQSSFFHISSSVDPWLIQTSAPNQWDKSTQPPSLFDPDDDESPPITPPSSPPNIAAIKKSLIQAQQFLSTASHIDPWTVSQPNPSTTPNASKGKKKKDGNIEEEITQQNLYKTELCRSFMETNTCRYGVKCQFAHGRHELRPVMRHPKYKTEICKTFHTLGTCPYGTRCRFIHTRPKDGAPADPSSADSSAPSSEFSSPTFTPPDSPSLLASTSPPEILQWSTSWTSLEQRSLPPSPQQEDDKPVQPAQPEQQVPTPDSPPDDELTPARRLPIFRDIATC